LRRVIEAQRSGGVRCYTGKDRTDGVVTLYPAVPFIITDNKEAHSLAMIKTGKTSHPCRFCKTDSESMHNFSTRRNWEYRTFTDLKAITRSSKIPYALSYHSELSKVRYIFHNPK